MFVVPAKIGEADAHTDYKREIAVSQLPRGPGRLVTRYYVVPCHSYPEAGLPEAHLRCGNMRAAVAGEDVAGANDRDVTVTACAGQGQSIVPLRSPRVPALVSNAKRPESTTTSCPSRDTHVRRNKSSKNRPSGSVAEEIRPGCLIRTARQPLAACLRPYHDWMTEEDSSDEREVIQCYCHTCCASGPAEAHDSPAQVPMRRNER